MQELVLVAAHAQPAHSLVIERLSNEDDEAGRLGIVAERRLCNQLG